MSMFFFLFFFSFPGLPYIPLEFGKGFIVWARTSNGLWLGHDHSLPLSFSRHAHARAQGHANAPTRNFTAALVFPPSAGASAPTYAKVCRLIPPAIPPPAPASIFPPSAGASALARPRQSLPPHACSLLPLALLPPPPNPSRGGLSVPCPFKKLFIVPYPTLSLMEQYTQDKRTHPAYYIFFHTTTPKKKKKKKKNNNNNNNNAVSSCSYTEFRGSVFFLFGILFGSCEEGEIVDRREEEEEE